VAALPLAARLPLPRPPPSLTHTLNAHTRARSLVRVVSRETKIPEDECFALMALSELEDQFLLLKKMGLIKEKTEGAA
jgi:hypothetical protein